MQEREYFRQICMKVINSNKGVRFAAVVDNRGRLLSGHSSSKYDNRCTKRVTGTAKSAKDWVSFCEVKNEGYQFFTNCLVPVLKLNNNTKHLVSKAHRDLIPLYDMISPINKFVKIGITPLTEGRDRFLCVYTDLQDTETQLLA